VALEEIMFDIQSIRPSNQRFIITSPLEPDTSVVSIFEIETMVSFLANNLKTLMEYIEKSKGKIDVNFIKSIYNEYRENKYVDTMETLKKKYGEDYDVARFIGFFGAYPTENMAKKKVAEIQKAGYPFVLDVQNVENTLIPYNQKEMTNLKFKDEMLNKLYENSVTRIHKAKKEISERKAALLQRHDLKPTLTSDIVEISDFPKESLGKKNIEIETERKVLVSSTSGVQKTKNDIKSLIIEEVRAGGAKSFNVDLIKTMDLPKDVSEAIINAHKK
jgi:hypothetical protein